jgi:hypothetical protein
LAQGEPHGRAVRAQAGPLRVTAPRRGSGCRQDANGAQTSGDAGRVTARGGPALSNAAAKPCVGRVPENFRFPAPTG